MKSVGVWLLYFPLSLVSFCFPGVKQELLNTVWSSVYTSWRGGGGFVKDGNFQIRKQRGIFQADFGVVKDHLLNCTKSLIQAKFQLRTASFYRLKYDCTPHIFRRWTLRWCELARVFLGVSRPSIPLSEKL